MDFSLITLQITFTAILYVTMQLIKPAETLPIAPASLGNDTNTLLVEIVWVGLLRAFPALFTVQLFSLCDQCGVCYFAGHAQRLSEVSHSLRPLTFHKLERTRLHWHTAGTT